jgi:hypothetical protein
MSGMLGRTLASLTRRRFLLGAGAAAGAGAAVAAGVAIDRAVASGGPARPDAAPVPPVQLGAQPAGLPARQHAWNASLARDQYGNPVPPLYHRLLFFDVNGAPSAARARVFEAALRTLERAYPWAPHGLLFTAGWGQPYFADVLRVTSPIPVATGLSDFELPAIDEYHLCLHLASDDQSRLAAVEAALVRGAPLPAADGPLDVSSALRWRETRTGFIGAGLPAERQHTGGIPPGDPVPATAPLFMGFKSSLSRNQATEDDVTIPDGPFAGGTTMHASYMRLSLDDWYGQLSVPERVARMYAPQVTPEQVTDDFTTDAESDPALLGQAISRYGVIGHSQTSARARRAGRPIILRRDFNTTDGGQAGLHFVSIQRTIADFVTTRSAMNATSAQLQNPVITDTVNNGINSFIFVLKRGNYLIPARAGRSFPSLDGVS